MVNYYFQVTSMVIPYLAKMTENNETVIGLRNCGKHKYKIHSLNNHTMITIPSDICGVNLSVGKYITTDNYYSQTLLPLPSLNPSSFLLTEVHPEKTTTTTLDFLTLYLIIFFNILVQNNQHIQSCKWSH